MNKQFTGYIQNIRIDNLQNEKNRAVPNQFVLQCGTIIQFQSYVSPIITIDYDDFTISVHPKYDYSSTTSKWRNYFLKDYYFSGIATTKDLNNALKEGYTIDDRGNKWTVRREVV